MLKSFLCTAVAAVAVVFTVRAEYAWHYDSSKNRIWTEDSDTGETNWVFSVTKSNVTTSNTNLTLNAYVSGEGDLDFSTFSVEGVSLTSAGNNALSSQPALTGLLNTGPITSGMARYNPNLKQLILPNVKTLVQYGYQNSAITNLTLSSDLEEVQGDVLGSSCTSIQSITPEYLPKLKTIGSFYSKISSPASLTIRFDLPALETISGNGFGGKATIAKFNAPKLKSLGACTFRYNPFAEGAGDLVLPELETLTGTETFKSSGLTSIHAPKLTSIPGQTFNSCLSLTNMVFSGLLKTVVAGAVNNCPNLANFTPLLPTNMTAVTDFFGTTTVNLLGGPLVWDQDSTTVIAASFMAYSPLTNFVFVSDVTSVGKQAFAKIGPKAEIHFYGPTVPTLGNGAFYRTNAEANNDRPTIHFHNSSSAVGWMTLAAPNADKLEAYKEKPDCPADVVGLIALPNASGTTPIYAYLVNDATVAGTGYLTIQGVPLEFADIDPAYGVHADIPIGDTFPCTAPSVCSETDMRGGLAGYVVSNVLATGEMTFRDEGKGNSYAYEQLEDSAQLTWIWTNVQYRVTAAGEGGGSVDVAEQWVDYLGTATVTAVPAAGKIFRYWTGDVPSADIYRPTIELLVDRAKTVKAVFTDPVDYVWSYDADAKRITYGGSDGLDSKWVFAVTENSGKLTISKYISGEGDLDFSTFAVEGKTLVSCKDVFQSTTYLTGRLNTGTMTTVGKLSGNHNLKQLELPSVTSIGTYSLQGNAELTNLTLSVDIEEVGGGICGGCNNLQSITPRYLPKLRSIGSFFDKGSPSSLTYCFELPVLEKSGYYAGSNSGSPTFACFKAPVLKSISGGAFSRVNFASGAGDLVFPELEDIGGQAFQYSKLTSIRAPALTNLNSSAFSSCSVLTNAVFSDALKIISTSAFDSCGALSRIEPLLPSGMTQIASGAFGGGGSTAAKFTGTFVWDNPDIPEVPAKLMAKSPLSSVVFRSDVTAVRTNAFISLAPYAVVEFHGATVPELDTLPFWRNGETANDRIRIRVCNPAAVEGWKALVAENDALYKSTFRRKKPDYPGAGTLGILTLQNGTTRSYAWVTSDYPSGLVLLVW